MKRVQLLFFLCIFVASFSQPITVNTTVYSAKELINQVLINSPCVSGTNVSSKTGTFFGSTNGIGYFENSNPSFPFSKGVILTTGDATKTPGPNNTILNDGNTAWTGDADLEANLLSQSGITIKSVNASYIEFDFQPKTPNFDLSFLFASEEYGTAQCDFSDAFAFLLKDVTSGGPNVNLAVIPGTSIPISVETIRNNTFNTNCPSANANYFGAFNGNGFGPAINFNGQTVEMIASATGLNINHIYHIKLVIADGGNNTGYDSAIFLEANSFNIGQDVLGLDYTAANNKSICPGDKLPILSAVGLSMGTTFVWKKDGVDFSPAQTGNTLDLNTITPSIGSGIHEFSVTYIEPSCTEVTDEISVEILPAIGVIPTVPNIYTCDSGAVLYDFDLTKNTKIILAGTNQLTSAAGILDDLPTGTIISYHLTNNDAIANIGATSSPFTILNSENGKIIYARIGSPTSSCYEIRSFKLMIVAGPIIANTPNDITQCARNITDSTKSAYFDLTPQKNSILGLQDPLYSVISFHSTFDGANTNTNILTPNSSNVLLSSSRTLWVRLQNFSDSSCYIVTSFQLTVTPLPLVDIIKDVYVCSFFTLPALTNTGAQYWTGSNGTGIQLFAGDTINTTIELYIFNKTGSCTNQSSFKITIVDLEGITPTSSSYCTEYKLPALAYGKYFTKSGGTSTLGNIELTKDSIINTTGINTIYVWFEDTTVTPSCIQEKPFEITIIPFMPLPDYINQFGCNSYTLPNDTNGGTYYSGPNKGLPIIPAGTVINTTTPIYVFKETGTLPTNCLSEKTFTVYIGIPNISPPANVNSCSAYILPKLTVGEYRTESSGGGSLILDGTSINATTTIWYYVPGQNCTNSLQFTVTVNIAPLPIITNTPPQCDIYYLPTVAHSGNYYTGPLGTGTMRPAGFAITSTQTMYFYDKASTGTCYVEEKFLITVNPSPPIDARPVEVLKCGDKYILDNLVNGEYYEFSGGPSPTNPVLPPGYELTSSKIIYVYASAKAPNTCISEYSISFLITMVNDIPDKFACDTYSLPAIVGLGDYYTSPGGPKGIGKKLTPPYTPITANTKLYVYADSNNRVFCSDETMFNINIVPRPIANPVTPLENCDTYGLNDGIFQFDLTTSSIRNEVLNGQTPDADFTLTFFTSLADANNPLATPIATPSAYDNDNPFADSVWIRVTNNTLSDPCFAVTELKLIVNPLPKPQLDAEYFICEDRETGTLINPATLDTGLTRANYKFEWTLDGAVFGGNTSSITTYQTGNYIVKVTNTTTACTNTASSKVIKYTPYLEITYSDAFENQTFISVNVLGAGSGNYEYKLDDFPFQESNIFNNVWPGEHVISVRDKDGHCNPASINAVIINYPRYFTPNGDGFHETWNIIHLRLANPNAPIFIFDRYGKLIKEITPSTDGWNGTFNGQPLPSTDYWFTTDYMEKGVSKTFKSHFSLKR